MAEKLARPTITYSDSIQEMKTEPIPAQLPTEQETTPPIQEEQPLTGNEWAQNDWNYYCRGGANANVLGGHVRGAKQGRLQRGETAPAWPNIRGDHGWDVYAKSDWGTKTN